MAIIYIIIMFFAGFLFGFLVGESCTLKSIKKDAKLKTHNKYKEYKQKDNFIN
jgi:hypothetical protein